MRDTIPIVRSPDRVESTTPGEGPGAWMCRFECAAGAPAWSKENQTGDVYVAAFPTTPVAIRHEGRPEVIADRTKVMLYNPGQVYRRRRIAGLGDACDLLVVRPAFAHACFEAIDRPVEHENQRLFENDHTACPPELFAAERLLSASHAEDQLGKQESVVRLALYLFGSATAPVGRAPRRTLTQAHRDLAHAACELLAQRAHENLKLTQVADALDVSPFHLCRVFSHATGTTITKHRNNLRVRLGADLLRDKRLTITRVAFMLGFSSHAHFTRTFAEVIGVAPSVFRGRIAGRAR